MLVTQQGMLLHVLSAFSAILTFHTKLGKVCAAAAAVSANGKAVQVIADITRRMGEGMAKYIQQDVETIADYDEYCHFVAGLVGVGLSQV